MSSEAWDRNQNAWTEDLDEKRVLFQAIDSFYQYKKTAHYNTTHLRRRSFYALPRAHWEMLAAPPFSYLDTLDSVDEAVDKNAELAGAIVESGVRSFGVSPEAPEEWRGTATANDLEKARSTLRQFFRDWSSEGAAEREACYGPVIRALKEERSSREDSKMRVLVPGAGLGRLVFELCLNGFDVEGNEISYHQLLASFYILNDCAGENVHTLFPWIHSFSNHRSRVNHLASVQVPDVQAGNELAKVSNIGEMSMSASDFLCLYGQKDQQEKFDAVAAVFFLDTAPNVVRYLETIRNCLKTGGLLINMGPLLWHFENNAPGTHGREATFDWPQEDKGIADPGSVELTDDEVLALVDKLGFDIEKREAGLAAPYIQDSKSMLHNTYQASHWVGRKR